MDLRKKILITYFFFFFYWITLSDAKKLPIFLKTCKRYDPQLRACLLKEANAAIKEFCKGIPEYGVPVIDPLYVGKADIFPKNSALQMKQQNIIAYGIQNAAVMDYIINIGNKTGSFRFIGDATFIGQYELKGQFLLFYLNGLGNVNIEFEKYDLEVIWNWDTYNGMDGAEYYRMLNTTYKLDYKDVSFQIDGLFNNNALLNTAFKNFLTENKRFVIDELGLPILNVLVKRIVKILNKFFSIVPFDNWLPIK